MQKASLAGLCLATSIASLIPSYVGLVGEIRYLTVIGFIDFTVPFLFLFFGLYRSVAPRTNQFGLDGFLNAVGSFGLFSMLGYDLEPYVEGSLLFSGFLIVLFIYGHSISGAASYVLGQGFSALLFFTGFALIMASVVNYNMRFRSIISLLRLCQNGKAREKMSKRFQRYISFAGSRPIMIAFIVGALANAVGFHLLSVADGTYTRMFFYATQAYQGPVFSVYVLEPMDVLGTISQQIGISIISGFLAVNALMILSTLSLLTYLNTESVASTVVLDPYNISPVRRISELLTSFWIMTSSGLTIFPLLTVIGNKLAEVGRHNFAEVQFLMALTYPAFLVSMFVISSALVRRFIGCLKARAVDKTSAALLDAKGDHGSYDELASELSLVDRVPEGPSGGIFMQLFQIIIAIGIALVNLFGK